MFSFLVTVLICSSVAMIALLYAKHWELSTGRVILGTVRPRIGAFFDDCLIFVERRLPALALEVWKRFLMWLRHSALSGLAKTLLALEQSLEKMLHTLRHGTTPPVHAKGQASAFLREVAEHKKQLLTRAEREQIAEDQ